MTDWFARPVLHVKDVEASLRFYIDRLGFTSPWRYDEDGRAHVAQVDRGATEKPRLKFLRSTLRITRSSYLGRATLTWWKLNGAGTPKML